MPVQRPYNPNAKQMAEMMQADLAKVGVNAKLVTFEWGEYLQARCRPASTRWASSAGPATTATRTTSSTCCWLRRPARAARTIAQVVQQATFDDLIDAGQADLRRQAKRTELYKKAQVIFKEEAPWFPIAHSVVYMPMSKKVEGYKVDPARHCTSSTASS